MTIRSSISATLAAALTLAAYASVGAGMEMGPALKGAPTHACCPSRAPKAKKDSLSPCCLLAPAAATAPAELPGLSFVCAILAGPPSVACRVGARTIAFSTGPPGRAQLAATSLGAPRAPPAA